MAGLWIKEKDMVIHIHVPDAEGYFVVDGKRIYFDFHDYMGPTFWKDKWHDEQVDYDDYPEGHKLWDQFGKWHRKYQKAKDLKQKQYEDSRNRSCGVHRNEPVQLTLDLRPLRPRSGQPERRL